MLRNLGGLGFELSMPFNVKCEGVTGLPINGFLLMFNSNKLPKLDSFTRYELSKSE